MSKQSRDFIDRLKSYYKDRKDVEVFTNPKMINFDIAGSDYDIDRLTKVFRESPTYIVECKLDIKDCVERLCDELRGDEDYYRSWKDNIAMAFKDEFNRIRPLGENISGYSDLIHAVANNAADNFLKLLIM